ncbi:cytochrome c peroxidase [Spirosoma soli]|uniref:Cytochrome c peroxidase n=1 Tax=Spirosoma soli TaxID=1770529 RepID=A0ABW5M3L9_9BACT
MLSEQTPATSVSKANRTSVRWTLMVLATGLIVAVSYYLLQPRLTPVQQVKAQYLKDIAGLDSSVRHLNRIILSHRSVADMQSAFRSARLAYKRVEFLAELYNPETAKSLNGPALPEVEEDDGLQRQIQPEGFQVIEELLFPYDPAQHQDLLTKAAVLQSNVGRLTKVASTNEMTDSHVFDAIRLEVFRLLSLGITGFDSPVSTHSLPEAAAALESLQRYVSIYEPATKDAALATLLDRTFAGAISALKSEKNFNSFDRLGFITNHANVLSGLLLDTQKALEIPVFQESRLLSTEARTLNDLKAFDTGYFVNTNDDRPTPARVALGKLLFYDPILSGDSRRTCATCHQPDKAFTDGEPKSLAIGFGGRRIARNAPTLLNATFQAAQFADSRVIFLEDQASDVIQNTQEMHGSLPKAVSALRNKAAYRKAFADTYKDGITEQNLKNAVASYIRSLTNLDSRVDRYLRGQPTALTSEEKHGFNLFMGKAKCATCHFYPLFNGTVPPAYQKTESEVLGTPATAENRQLDPDLGKFQTTKIHIQKHAFKTPTIRNVAKTAPYMHNGVYRSLEEVVDFYDKGGGNGLGFNLDNQTLPEDKLHLTPGEKKALVAFMKAL